MDSPVLKRAARNEGRVRALKSCALNAKKEERVGQVNLQLHEAGRSGHEVVEVIDLHYAWDEQVIVDNFSLTIMRGDRIGLIGPNGCGKTTLLKILLGQLKPQKGQVKLGTRLRFATSTNCVDSSMKIKPWPKT